MTAKTHSAFPSRVDAAADWFALRRSGKMSLQEAQELEAWLGRDASNRIAYQEIARAWAVTQQVATDPEVLALREAAIGQVRLRRRLNTAASALAMAAPVVFGVYFAGLAGLWQDWLSPVSDQRFQTAVGQTVTVSLADGSSVVLDSDTAMSVHETWRRRAISLEHGQAFFHVAKDPARPFVVSAAGSSVMATGTAFDLRVDADRLYVLLAEGRLHVDIAPTASAPAQQANMVAGWQLTAGSDGARALVPLDAASVERALGWRTGHLTFVGQTVFAAAAEMNRYSLKKIIVLPGLTDTPIDGVFRTGDVDGFVNLLVKGHLARVLYDTDSAITLASLKKGRPLSQSRVHGF